MSAKENYSVRQRQQQHLNCIMLQQASLEKQIDAFRTLMENISSRGVVEEAMDSHLSKIKGCICQLKRLLADCKEEINNLKKEREQTEESVGKGVATSQLANHSKGTDSGRGDRSGALAEGEKDEGGGLLEEISKRRMSTAVQYGTEVETMQSRQGFEGCPKTVSHQVSGGQMKGIRSHLNQEAEFKIGSHPSKETDDFKLGIEHQCESKINSQHLCTEFGKGEHSNQALDVPLGHLIAEDFQIPTQSIRIESEVDGNVFGVLEDDLAERASRPDEHFNWFSYFNKDSDGPTSVWSKMIEGRSEDFRKSRLKTDNSNSIGSNALNKGFLDNDGFSNHRKWLEQTNTDPFHANKPVKTSPLNIIMTDRESFTQLGREALERKSKPITPFPQKLLLGNCKFEQRQSVANMNKTDQECKQFTPVDSRCNFNQMETPKNSIVKEEINHNCSTEKLPTFLDRSIEERLECDQDLNQFTSDDQDKDYYIDQWMKEEKSKRRYQICKPELKKEVLKHCDKLSPKEVSEMFSIPEKNIRRWICQEHERKKGAGRKMTDPVMERILLDWIAEYFRQNSKLPEFKQIKQKAREVNRNKQFLASKGWRDKFMKRNRLFFAKLTEDCLHRKLL